MFGFLKRNSRKSAAPLLRRLLDRSAPNLPRWGEESRGEDRSNRTVPVLLVPFEEGELQTQDAAFALTKDLSSAGLALTLPQPLRLGEVIIGILGEDGPEYLKGVVRQHAPVGGGFWQLGIEIRNRLLLSDWPALAGLERLAVRLHPR